MLINLTELFSREGKEKTYTCSIDMDTLTTMKEAFPIVSKGPVSLQIRNLGNRKLLLTGSAEITLQIPCSRCLEPVVLRINLPKQDVTNVELTGK